MGKNLRISSHNIRKPYVTTFYSDDNSDDGWTISSYFLLRKKRVTNNQTSGARVKQIFEESYSSEADSLGGQGGVLWTDIRTKGLNPQTPPSPPGLLESTNPN
jgi:hypothetical protein